MKRLRHERLHGSYRNVARRKRRVFRKREETVAIGVSQSHADSLIRKHWGASAHLTCDTDTMGTRYYRNGVAVTSDVWDAKV